LATPHENQLRGQKPQIHLPDRKYLYKIIDKISGERKIEHKIKLQTLMAQKFHPTRALANFFFFFPEISKAIVGTCSFPFNLVIDILKVTVYSIFTTETP
jgi:hypothetical protein